MRKSLIFIGALLCSTAIADESGNVPFYYSAGTAVEPQVRTLLVGMDQNAPQAQANVSADRKYVTLGIDTSLLSAQGIRTFTYQSSHMGFVGTAAPAAGNPNFSSTPADKGNELTPTIKTSPSEIAPVVSPLLKPGMTRIAGLGSSSK